MKSRKLSRPLLGAILLSVIASVVISGCIKTRVTTSGLVNITDMAGRTVAVPRNVEKVVGIEAGALRLIVYLGAVDKVVGVEDFEKRDKARPYRLAHPELGNLTSIGPMHGGDAELIAAARPDVIFWTYAEAGAANDLQQKTGIPVVVIKYGDLSRNRKTFYEALRLMGRILGKEKRAEDVIEYVNRTIEDLTDRTKDIPPEKRPTCYVGGVGYRGAHGILSTESDYAPFLFVGANNVASKAGQGHAFVDAESVVQWNPEIVFVDEVGYSLVLRDLRNNTAFSMMKAIQSQNVYGILPYNYYTTNYGTVLADAYYIGKVLYPEAFADVNPREKADEIYEKLVGKAVYADMEQIFGGFKRVKLEG